MKMSDRRQSKKIEGIKVKYKEKIDELMRMRYFKQNLMIGD